MFVFNFGVGSLEQSVKLGQLVIFDFFDFFQTDNQKAVLFTVQLFERFFSCGGERLTLVKTPAIVSLANFQILLRHPKLAFDWLPVSFFDY